MPGQKTISTARMEAFSDGVLAIIITIRVLELKPPHEAGLPELLALWPKFLSYALSFLVLSIFWVNHHRIMRLATRADNMVLWINNLALFVLSLIPFATAFMGESHFAPLAAALYAGLQGCAVLCYRALWTAIARHHRDEPEFQEVVRAAKRKNLLGISIFASAVPVAYLNPYCTLAMTFLVAGMYVIPEMWVEQGARVCGLGPRATG